MEPGAEPPYAFEHPSPGRYLVTPSAAPIGAGRGYFSQKEIAFSQVGVGLTDAVSVEVGSCVPTWFTRSTGGVFTVRAALPARDDLHVGGSLNLYAGWAWDDGVAGAMPTLDVTWGGSRGHLTARLGQTWFSTGSPDRLLPTSLVLAGERRVGDHTAFVTEWWLLADLVGESAFGDDQRTLAVPGAAVRGMTRRFTVDFGFVPLVLDNTLMPVPWIDFTAYWGR
jgi:hypothetical protein